MGDLDLLFEFTGVKSCGVHLVYILKNVAAMVIKLDILLHYHYKGHRCQIVCFSLFAQYLGKTRANKPGILLHYSDDWAMYRGE